MEQIIVALGLDPANLHLSKTFATENGQVEFTTLNVVVTFKWYDGTFTSKQSLYKSAKSIARLAWKGAEIETDPALVELQNIYRGIQFLWAENGPLADPGDTTLPLSDAEGDEKHAANLRQTDLEKHSKALLDKYTKEPQRYCRLLHSIDERS
ncbi:hypothetical protein C8R45DRAFT_1115266 [Mycena sanguinolenta]|nr:hypothetical protein C8R45DRAFT_1115266 [Mycena sanguinolenta]